MEMMKMKMKMKMKKSFASVALALLLVPAVQASEADVKVVTNASTGGVQIKREALRVAFLGTSARWADGQPVLAVDQSVRSSVRARFSESLLSQSVIAVQAHWMSQISSGKGRPPLTKASDAEVIAYVQATPGAIGYVAGDTSIEPGVKVLQVIQ